MPYLQHVVQHLKKMTINKKDFWDTNFYNHPDLTDEIVEIAEESLKVKLPRLLIQLLKIQNGGYTKGFVFPMKQKTTWAENYIPLNELFGIVINISIETGQNILNTNYMIHEWGLPDNQVLLAGDGHG